MSSPEVFKIPNPQEGLGPATPASRHASVRSLSATGHVGFDSLPDQLVNKAVCSGFTFNVLCIGETGLGKSTLIDTLFNRRFESSPATHDLPGVTLRSQTYDLKESNVGLRLTVVETVGFGDQIDKRDSYSPIVEYIDAQFEAYLQEELNVRRALHAYHDTRPHACLYFLPPTGHSLKALDLVTMKQLDSKVNLIPVIGKSDTITRAELSKFKAKIMTELLSNGVQLYQFPTDDETVAELNSAMNAHLPFAVVGSMDEVKVGSKMVKARQYLWGTVQVENETHSDFVRLREMLVRTNMEDLRETTHSRHYERYRRAKLQLLGLSDNDTLSVQELYEQKRAAHVAEMQRKEEEMRQMFVIKVKEKETELKAAESELQAKFETLKKEHAEDKRRLEDKRRALEDELHAFQRAKASLALALQAGGGSTGTGGPGSAGKKKK